MWLTKIFENQLTKKKSANLEKNSILEFNNKESASDVLNELLRDGAQ